MLDILLWITIFVLLIMETLVGMGANVFIVLVNFIDWFRRRKLSPNDLILTCLGLVRLMGQAEMIVNATMMSFFLHTYKLNKIRLSIFLMWVFTKNISLWFAACLSVWYLLKIATFSHFIYLQLKQRASQLVPWLLLGSVVFSAITTVIAITGCSSKLDIYDLSRLLLNNSSDSETEGLLFFRQFPNIIIVLNVIPSVIILLSTVLLIISLWRHVRHLQHHGIGVRDLNTQVHLTAIKALVSFAVLYLSSFVVSTSYALLIWGRNNPTWTSVLFPTVSALYPSAHAVILILINPKLKQAWVKMMLCFKCPLSEAPS